jgi:hypothetical protein
MVLVEFTAEQALLVQDALSDHAARLAHDVAVARPGSAWQSRSRDRANKARGVLLTVLNARLAQDEEAGAPA